MLEAVEAVCYSEGDAGSALEGVASLLDKSLLKQDEQGDGEARFWMLETIREYALEELKGSAEAEGIRRQHALYFLRFAEEADKHLHGAEQTMWFERLERERDNFRICFDWCATTDDGDVVEMGLRLAGALWWFWDARGYYSEGRERASAMLALARERGHTHTVGYAKALNTAGRLAWRENDIPLARSYLEASESVAREVGDEYTVALALHNLGLTYDKREDPATARLLTEQSLAIRREIGDGWGIRHSLYNLGVTLYRQRDWAGAHGALKEVLTLGRQSGDKLGINYALDWLGVVASAQGEYAEARLLWEEALAISKELGHKTRIIDSIDNLGVLATVEGDYDTASSLFEAALEMAQEVGVASYTGNCLYSLGYVAWRKGAYDEARSLYGQSSALYHETLDRESEAYILYLLAQVARDQQDYGSAVELLKQSLAFYKEIGTSWMHGLCMVRLAGIAALRGHAEDGARLLGAAEVVDEATSTFQWPPEQKEDERDLADVRAGLDEVSYQAALAEGKAMTPEEGVVYALKVIDALVEQGFVERQLVTTPMLVDAARLTYPVGLTEREVEVLRLAAQGLSSAQIAKRLFLSRNTVHAHLRSVYSKIGVSSRTAAAHYAVEHGLI